MRELSMELPTGYHLERVPDMLVLRRHDGVMVGAFSPRGVTSEAVRRTVEEIARQELREPDTPDSEAPNQGSQDATPSKLQARFFGHFELMCDEEILDLGPNGKALTILKYLLANRSRPVSQDHLMGWLWPESNLKKARWSLNSAIHALRKLLSRSPHSVAVNYVLLEEGYYSLSPEIGVSTDVDEFDARYERGRLLERTGEAAQATSEYEKAIELYRGDYLVEDLYEDWTMVERERLANAYVDMLDRLAAHYLQNGQFRESVRCCYLALEKDRCHEASYRLLIRCYSQMGRLSSAVRQYRMCEHILEQEYGTSPSIETKSLLEGITMV